MRNVDALLVVAHEAAPSGHSAIDEMGEWKNMLSFRLEEPDDHTAHGGPTKADFKDENGLR